MYNYLKKSFALFTSFYFRGNFGIYAIFKHYNEQSLLSVVQQGTGTVTASTNLLGISHHYLKPMKTCIMHATTVPIISNIEQRIAEMQY